MGRLVEDLLLLARLDEGRPLEYETVDLESVVREVVADVLVMSPTREVTISAPHKVVVEGDEARLRQVVVNLITNAVRHTPPEAKIQVRVLEEGEGAVLEVEDAGPGMTQEDAQRAFDRFWQADPSRSRAGAGLGLAIVRSIVDAHCGDISLISNPLTGTRVTVTIPQSPPVTDKT
jgi:two-component system OmpR family sensor kinase